MRRLIPPALVLAAIVALPASAGAAKLPKDVTRTTYRYPIDLRPGTNIIKIRFGVPKPQGPGTSSASSPTSRGATAASRRRTRSTCTTRCG
jgi:hypothetical protein